MKNIRLVGTFLLMAGSILSCSDPGYVNEDYEKVVNLTVELEKKDQNLLILLNSTELYQCPANLKIERVKETEEYIHLQISDEIYSPASPCLAVYSPKPAGTVLNISNSGSGEKKLTLKFGKTTVTGSITFGSNSEISLEQNCCIKIITGESASEN